MKTYMTPYVEYVSFATEAIADVDGGNTSGEGNDDME